MLALSSTDIWMENLIKKKGKKRKGKALEAFSQESLDIGLDPFKEYNCYIKQPQLRQDDCPNVISWYGGK